AARERADAAVHAASSLDAAREGFARATALVTDVAARARAHDVEVERAGSELLRARDTAAAAERKADGAAGRNPAAAAAEGVGPGDACPVCAQSIPAGFKQPVAKADRSVKRAVTDTRSVLADAERAHERARTHAERDRDAAAAAERACDEARAKLEVA